MVPASPLDAQGSAPTGPEPVRWTLAIWLATGLGVSRDTPAPGTVGALWGLPLSLAIAALPGQAWQLTAIGILILMGGPLCGRAAADLARLDKTVDAKDPQAITWDEFTTVPLVFALAPDACRCAIWLALGFGLHRLFDITKPWPCRRLERLPGGWGIMADDVMAACYAAMTLAVLWRVWPG
ncbi:phosphatidylglycerophosphatase A family protein [Botrimarina hoheduenensis]|uniref:Phosphatidylglycerophosphatase A n=1 Tax=Botrimarina hoheduenensis TaxID=2528000 RepID=A0A5C5WEI4_9BACT|nr:phosphatidylglycerophosphatase A [Botrimarina hoheduenensis]TWT48481.1 Phosphatidylglycerophosphatase A [Botrimarina hoheduenensis]